MDAKGIDVSSHQGSKLDWSAIAKENDFVILRTSYGRWIDAQLDNNYLGATSAGLLVGGYHFLTPRHTIESQVNMLGSIIERFDFKLPIFIDIETDPYATAQASPEFVKNFLEEVLKFDVELGIYTSSWMWLSIMRNVTDPFYKQFDLWVADWRSGVSQPIIPKPWTTYRFWQTSSTGSVPNYSGNIDTDLFNGSREDLYGYAGNTLTSILIKEIRDLAVDTRTSADLLVEKLDYLAELLS